MSSPATGWNRLKMILVPSGDRLGLKQPGGGLRQIEEASAGARGGLRIDLPRTRGQARTRTMSPGTGAKASPAAEEGGDPPSSNPSITLGGPLRIEQVRNRRPADVHSVPDRVRPVPRLDRRDVLA